MRSLIVASLALGLLAPPALRGQEFADLCRQHRIFRNGQWSSYRMVHDNDTATMRFAIVGAEGTGAAARYLYEVSIGGRHRGKVETTIMQMQVSGLGTGSPHVWMLVMKSGDRPAMKYPDQMIGMASRVMTESISDQIAKNCANAQVVGWESVTVPDGTFRALHVRSQDGGDAWVAREIPFGMVQVRSKDGRMMVLTGHGANARTAITETPQDMMGGRH